MRIFLDIGAWNGDTAKSVLTSKHEFDKIYCFEPQPDMAAEIRKIESDKIVVQEFGLWNKYAEVPLYIGRKTDGATIHADKFETVKEKKEVKMVRASEWFKHHINDDDYVVMKLNCEGAECDILDDLIDSGEFKKVDALMVDFDVRKIASQLHREAETKERLKAYDIPMYFVGQWEQHEWKRMNGTHYWMDKILT